MSSEAAAKTGQLGTTLATWIYSLYASGRVFDDADIAAACQALSQVEEGEDVALLGTRLVAAVEAGLGAATGIDGVVEFVGRLFGKDHITTELGDDRETRAQAARSYQFRSNLPWMARIIDRFPDGTVGPHWVMVERVTDHVTCMDPYPWDDLDEEYHAPVVEFMVKWELGGCRGFRFV